MKAEQFARRLEYDKKQLLLTVVALILIKLVSNDFNSTTVAISDSLNIDDRV